MAEGQLSKVAGSRDGLVLGSGDFRVGLGFQGFLLVLGFRLSESVSLELSYRLSGVQSLVDGSALMETS